MVWIHGGAYLFGSGSAPGNQGHTFARDGVVFVSLNYRLGALGFLHAAALDTACEPGSGNYGLADQVAALRWVQENIAAFGGDSANVTIFGVSAGANYTQSLTVCPPAKGLFDRAISESAGGLPLFGLSADVGAAVARAWADRLPGGMGVDVSALSPEQLLETQAALLADVASGSLEDIVGDLTVPFYPLSGTDHQPLSVVEGHATGASAGVPMIIGTNRHEMSIFKLMAEFGGSREIRPRTTPQPWEDAMRALYAGTEPEATDERIRWMVEGDRGFRVPNLRAVEARVRAGSPTWVYEFGWESPAFDGRAGAAHGLEVPFVFDDFTTTMAALLTGDAPPPELARTMHQAWIAFAGTGRPTAPALPHWPLYDCDSRHVAVFDVPPHLAADPDAKRRVAWEGIDIRHALPTTGDESSATT
jgi:para-nitrobenzyl esterase